MTTKGVTMSEPATERQIAYIQSLIEKKFDPERRTKIYLNMKQKPLSKLGASRTIEKLTGMPDFEEPITLGDMKDGIYTLGDRVIKVTHTQPRFGKRLKVKQFDPRVKKFYAVGKRMAKQVIEEAKPMPLEEAQKFGKLYGICVICNATLTDEESIAYGIGPTCRKRWGL